MQTVKRTTSFVILLLLLFNTVSAYAFSFDYSLFTESEDFLVEYDDMDGTGQISHVNECWFSGNTTNESEYIDIYVDIKIFDDYPPVVRLTLFYLGLKPLNISKVIMKPSDTRYTFTVSSNIGVNNGLTQETVVLAITDENWQLMHELYMNTGWSDMDGIDCRVIGTREIDFVLNCDMDNLMHFADIYNTYDNALTATHKEFSAIERTNPCEVKNPQNVIKRLSGLETSEILNDEWSKFTDLISEFNSAITYWNDNDFSTVDDVHVYEAMWKKMADAAASIARKLTETVPVEPYPLLWLRLRNYVAEVATVLTNCINLDANRDGSYAGEEMLELIKNTKADFVSYVRSAINVIEQIKDLSELNQLLNK